MDHDRSTLIIQIGINQSRFTICVFLINNLQRKCVFFINLQGKLTGAKFPPKMKHMMNSFLWLFYEIKNVFQSKTFFHLINAQIWMSTVRSGERITLIQTVADLGSGRWVSGKTPPGKIKDEK